jgi:hypothetical protein
MYVFYVIPQHHQQGEHKCSKRVLPLRVHCVGLAEVFEFPLLVHLALCIPQLSREDIFLTTGRTGVAISFWLERACLISNCYNLGLQLFSVTPQHHQQGEHKSPKRVLPSRVQSVGVAEVF